MIFVANVLCAILQLFADDYLLLSAFEFKTKRNRLFETIKLTAIVLIPISVKIIFLNNVTINTLCMIVAISLQLLYLIFYTAASNVMKVLFIVIQEVILLVSEYFSQILLSNQINADYEQSFYNSEFLLLSCTASLLSISLYFVVVVLWRKFFIKKTFISRIYLLFVCFPLSQFIMVAANDYLLLTYDHTMYNDTFVIGVIMGLVADVVLAILVMNQQSKEETDIKLSEALKAWELEANHIAEINERRGELAKIRHDITDQLLTIRTLIVRDDESTATDMIDTLIENTVHTSENTYCADSTVNAILEEKARICKENQIATDFEISIDRSLLIHPVAICSLYSNLLKNAINASCCIEPEHRQILVKSKVVGAYLHVIVENNYSMRKNDNRRGYGMEIIRGIVRLHDGQMDVSDDNGVFRVEVSIENKYRVWER